jgi:hypothetical protein
MRHAREGFGPFADLDVDLGHGPARGFSARGLRAVADALARIDPETLRAWFDPGAMMAADACPNIRDRRPEEDDTLGYLIGHYEQLRPFIRDAAAAGEALPVYVS